jgi:anti-sigma factor RsiW
MLDLMQYADGELSGEAASRVEALLRGNEEARRVVDAMGHLGDVVRDGVVGHEGSSLADGIADRVMASIEPAVARQPAPNVVPMEARRRARGGAAAAVVAVFALAAGALLLLRSPQSSPLAREAPIEPATQAPAAVAPAPAPAVTAMAQVEAAPGIDLEEAHSTKHKLDVFFVPSTEGAGSAASVVVWIDDHHGGP